MAQKEYIKHLYEVEEKSLREISRICELNFRTVQKYARMENWNEIQERKESSYPVLGAYLEIIDEWLKADEKSPRKQRHTIQRIYKRLEREHGFSGSYGSVKKYVNKKKEEKRRQRVGYLPLAHEAGNAEIDFGEFVYEDTAGQQHKAYHFTMTFPHSNAGYVQIFKGENQECLLEGMKRIFSHIGGVPKRIKADNMTTAVIKILEEGKRELTEGFTRFKLHYRFETDFCNPASGNEKGNVENKVGYGRRNFFVPIPVIDDFDEYNTELLVLCDDDMIRQHYSKGMLISELWTEDKSELLSLPEYEYEVFRYESVRINSYGFVRIDTNSYGISPELSGKQGYVKIYYNKIEIYYERSLVKVYERSYGTNEEITDWRQYVSLLCKKLGGVEHTRFYNQIPKLWREHLQAQNGRERKSALLLLLEIVSDDMLDIGNEAIEISKLYGRSDTESIRQCYYALTHNEYTPMPIQLNPHTPTIDYNPNLNAYDILVSTEVRENAEQA